MAPEQRRQGFRNPIAAVNFVSMSCVVTVESHSNSVESHSNY
jgi:hypothetical protein